MFLKNMKLRLHEIILYVKDMDAQVSFYRDTLSLQLTFQSDDWSTFDTGVCTLALHSGSMGEIGTDAPNIVFKVDHLAEVRSFLIKKGVDLSDIRIPSPGIFVCDGVDPEGNRFSLEEVA